MVLRLSVAGVRAALSDHAMTVPSLPMPSLVRRCSMLKSQKPIVSREMLWVGLSIVAGLDTTADVSRTLFGATLIPLSVGRIGASCSPCTPEQWGQVK
jgi:hypothetical protein